jgi:hypothetical protein
MHMPSVASPLAGLLCAAGVFASGASAVAQLTPWGALRVSSSDGRETTDVEIASVLITNTADARPETTWINEKTERVWVAKMRELKTGAPAALHWADSRGCYQLVETLATLIDLDPPKDAPTLRIDDRSDAGTDYRIEGAGLSPAQGRSTAVRLADGREVRASLIVETALDAWRPCWSDAPPTLTARP